MLRICIDHDAIGLPAMTASPDVNLDDLRRRARRRLVGAIVLALAAAVFVPMLLERGVTEADVETMLVDNPRRLLAGA